MDRTTSQASAVASDEAAGAGLPDSPFRLRDAEACGLARDDLRSSKFTHLRRGVYACREYGTDRRSEVTAWIAAMPDDAALYGVTAAEWYRLPVVHEANVHVIVPAGGTVPRRRRGIVTHEGLGAADATVVGGLRVTTPERTWLDLSLTLQPTDLVAVGDAMVRKGLTTPERLVEASVAARRRRNIVTARAAARLVRGRVDSPPETKLRLALIAGGLPEPVVNPDLADDLGGWIGRPDLAYLDVKIAIQYEGDVHRTDKRRWRADIARDDVLVDHGWEVVRVTADDLRRPWLLCARVRRAMDRQGARLNGA